MVRVLAIVGAVALVAIAIVVRGVIDDDGDGDDPGGGGDGDLVVGCVRELEDVCAALDADVRVQDPGATIADADEIDAWVTFDPWPEIAAEQQGRNVFGGDTVMVAASDLVLLVRDDVDCETWTCLVDNGARMQVAPASTALGLLVLGAAATDLLGEGFASNDLTADALTLLRRIDTVRDPVEDMLLLGPAGPHATGTTEADIRAQVERAARAGELEVVPTGVSISVVVTGPTAERVADDIREPLRDAGWQVEGPVLTVGLPNAGVLVALSQEVS